MHRTQIRVSLQARQAALSTAVARLLVQNNEGEEQVALRIGRIYDRVQRQVYIFFAAILGAILLTTKQRDVGVFCQLTLPLFCASRR